MLRAADKWFSGYVRSVLGRPRRWPKPRQLFFCVADHFEPFRGGVSRKEAEERVARWVEAYAKSVEGFRDADGRSPRHTFFYPGDEYEPGCLDRLAELCAAGHGEVEVHLHHRADTAESLTQKLLQYRDCLHQRHGLLGTDAAGRPRYAFTHGNWALCNSRPDGDWCGVNEELAVLRETGCYADFTFPSAPSPTQPRIVNAIYRACDRGGRPRGHDRGEACRRSEVVNHEPSVFHLSSLVLVQGPLAVNWRRRKWGVLPRLENAELSGANPPTAERVDLWARQHIHVEGRPELVFVKVHTHGCVEANRAVLLGPAMRHMHEHLRARYNDLSEWTLHYVSAREMYNVIRAAENGQTGDTGPFRDYEILPPGSAERPSGGAAIGH